MKLACTTQGHSRQERTYIPVYAEPRGAEPNRALVASGGHFFFQPLSHSPEKVDHLVLKKTTPHAHTTNGEAFPAQLSSAGSTCCANPRMLCESADRHDVCPIYTQPIGTC